MSLRRVNFRWSSAREEDEHAKAFGELAEKGKGKGKVRSPLVGEVLLRRLYFFLRFRKFGHTVTFYFPDWFFTLFSLCFLLSQGMAEGGLGS